MDSTVERIVAFLVSIGLSVERGDVPQGAFLPGITIRGGTLLFDPDALTWPCDLLHEAGHLAVTPAAQRPTSSGTLPTDVAETEAIAWSYAATVHLGLPPDALFHEGGYSGKGARLAATFSYGGYPGAAGLAAIGLTRVGADAVGAGIAPYPNMVRWLRE